MARVDANRAIKVLMDNVGKDIMVSYFPSIQEKGVEGIFEIRNYKAIFDENEKLCIFEETVFDVPRIRIEPACIQSATLADVLDMLYISLNFGKQILEFKI